MNKFLLVPFLFSLCLAQAQMPGVSLQPDVWLRADRLGDNLSQWKDQSGNGNDAAASNSKSLNTNSLINFNGAVLFDGEDFKLNIPFNPSNTSQLTVVTVYSTRDTTDERAVWSGTVNPGQDVFMTTQRLSAPQGIAKYSEGNINLPVVNTSSQYWGKAGDGVDGASMLLGGAKTDTSDLADFSGDIAEFMVFDHLIGSVENQLLQSYLSLKYGTTFQFSDYIASNGDVVWDYLNNPDYSYSIAGIGRDDGFGLYQKQSTNTEEQGLLTIGAGHIALRNIDNSSVFKNGNFLIWGMNEKEPAPELSEEEIYPYAHPVMQRKWQMRVTGKDAQALPTVLQFDVKDIIGTSDGCLLAIDRSGTGDFASQDIEYIEADDISEGGIASFSNIVWDADKSGSDIFTLSFGMDNGARCIHPICHNDHTGSIELQVMGGSAPYSYSLSNDSISYKKDWTAESRFQNIENLAPGSYKLKVTDHGGNLATNTLVINNPDEFTTGLDSLYTLEMGRALTLDGGAHVSELETSFVWEGDNGFFSTDRKASIARPGNYTLTLVNGNGCKVTQTIRVNPLNNILFDYKLYPNPSRGDYSLDIALAEASWVKVCIYNIQGAMVSRETRDGGAHYSFRGYMEKAGLYFVEIDTSFGKETFKLIISK